MNTHPSYGAFTPAQISAFLSAQPGRWHAEVRRVDPLFGFENAEDAPLHKFKVTVSQTVKMTEHATFEVEAYGEADAESRANKLLSDEKFSDRLSWCEYDTMPTDEAFEIVEIEQKATA